MDIDMVEFEEELKRGEDETPDDVRKLKTWMFQEQVRIQARRDELMDFNHELMEIKQELEKEKNALNIREEAIKKRYNDNEAMITKKLKMLEDAYHQLELDKKALECEKLNFEHERSKYRRQKMSGAGSNKSNVHQYGGTTDAYDGTSFFRGVDSELALRKRYKELLKIFHPDNKCGDTKTLIKIQTEYDSLRSQYYEG